MLRLYYRLIFLFLIFPAIGFADGMVISEEEETPPPTNYTLLAEGAWLMTSNAGNESDVSGNNETLTQSGSAPTSSTVPSGYTGTSRDFERSDPDHLYHSDGGSTDIYGSDQPLTIVAWVRTEGNTNDQVIACKGGTGTDLQYYLRYDASDDGFWFCMSDDDTPTQVCAVSDAGMANNTWTHVVGVYDDSTLTIYVNGVVSTNGSNNPKSYSNGIQNGPGTFRIGSFGGSSHFDGLIYELGIFNFAFTSGQVIESYTYGLNGLKSSGE